MVSVEEEPAKKTEISEVRRKPIQCQ